MKPLWFAPLLAVVAATPAYAGSWSPQSIPDVALVVIVALGFLAIAGAMRGRRL